MKPVKALIIDDDLSWRNLTVGFFKEMFPEIETETASYAIEGLKKIQSFAPDILFLDVEMPHGNGFELLDLLPKRNFELVLSTEQQLNSNQVACYNPVGVLMKPTDKQSFYHIISMALEQLGSRKLTSAQSSNELKRVDIKNIVHIEANGSYCTVHFVNQKTLIVAKNLSKLEQEIASPNMFRAHRSHLVNLSHVQSFNTNGTLDITTLFGAIIPLSRNRKNDFLEAIKCRSQKPKTL